MCVCAKVGVRAGSDMDERTSARGARGDARILYDEGDVKNPIVL